jgi:cephalosporin hydroxylase
MTELWNSFLTHRGHLVHKWTHYFPIYEQHLSRFKNRPALVWEIGVGEGGSLQLWKRYLGPFVQVVGLDILDKHGLEEDQIAVRTGDQSDPLFLTAVLDEFGTPDAVIDDGSHMMDHVTSTFQFLYPRISSVGVYIVEDMHTAYWPEYQGGLKKVGSFIEVAKDLIDELNADHSRGVLPSTEFTRSTLSMHFYDSVVVFERGRHLSKHAPQIGGP